MASEQATFGTWLRRRRKALDLTQAELGRRVGYSAVTIRKIEADDLRPSRRVVDRLAEQFGIAPDQRPAFLRFALGEATAAALTDAPYALVMPPASTTAPPHNLPVPPTPLVGRTREMDIVMHLLRRADVRLVTLLGPGGIGKTRLALGVAAALQTEFSEGVYFVLLTRLSDPALVPATIARVLDLRETAAETLQASLVKNLRDRHLLLVLDNFERLTDAAPWIAELLAHTSRLKLLVTSRIALRLSSEQIYPVPPLSLPTTTHPLAPPALADAEAIQLYVRRAQAANPGFALTSENMDAVARICVSLDGLPLAIELAAAQERWLGSEAIAARLADNLLQTLADGPQDVPSHQRTFRATMDWSWDILDAEEQALFRRLAVFVGGITPVAVATVGGEGTQRDALEVLMGLADKSLLRPQRGTGLEPRFVMLVPIREYALERLNDSGEAEIIHRRHAEFCLTLAEEAAPQLAGPDQAIWLARLETEYDNLRAALDWAIETGLTQATRPASSLEPQSTSALAVRLAVAVWRFWFIRGYWSEGRQRLETILSRTEDAEPSQDRARLVNAAGILAALQGDTAAARFYLDQSLALYRTLGDRQGVAYTLNNRGNMAYRDGDYPAARQLYEASLGVLDELGNQAGVAAAYHNLGLVAWRENDYAKAERTIQASLAIRRRLGDKQSIAVCLSDLGRLAGLQGALDKVGLALALEACAELAGVGDPRRMVSLYAAAARLREVLNAPLEMDERTSYDKRLADARATLGAAGFQHAWAEGQTMSLEEASANALVEPPTHEMEV